MNLNNLNGSNCVARGGGPERSYLLAMEVCGLGDDIHAMPVVWQMIQDGYDVTVNCRAFHNPIWEACGANVTNEHEPFGMFWAEKNKNKYGWIASLRSWGGWECDATGGHTKGTMEEFAELLGMPLPEAFSWVDVLSPNYKPGSYVLLNTNSAEAARSLPKQTAETLRIRLSQGHEVRVLGHCETWQELLDVIYNASVVVSVECGVSNIAGALGRNLVVLTGMTDTEATIAQYKRYLPDFEYTEVKGYQPKGCARPCYRQAERGFFGIEDELGHREKEKCLGIYDEPRCLLHLDLEKVLESVNTYLTIGMVGIVFRESLAAIFTNVFNHNGTQHPDSGLKFPSYFQTF